VGEKTHITGIPTGLVIIDKPESQGAKLRVEGSVCGKDTNTGVPKGEKELRPLGERRSLFERGNCAGRGAVIGEKNREGGSQHPGRSWSGRKKQGGKGAMRYGQQW